MINKYKSSWRKLCLLLTIFSINSFANGQVEVDLASNVSLDEPVTVKLISWHDNGYTSELSTVVNNKVVFEDVPAAKFDVFVELESQKSTAKAHGEVIDNEITQITLQLD